MIQKFHPISVGIAWCLAWGEGQEPKHDLNILQQMRQALIDGTAIPQEVSYLVDAVRELENLKFPETLDELKKVAEDNPILWNSKIGLVYGGATKIKQYVFEEAKLPDIRGASALLDRINLVDLPTFFNQKPENLYKFYIEDVQDWLNQSYPQLSLALIPELIIYSCGGNILAFCPPAFVDIITNAIEKRYTQQTISANSGAVGDSFRTKIRITPR
jgi:CRISPR-associated protein Cmr2